MAVYLMEVSSFFFSSWSVSDFPYLESILRASATALGWGGAYVLLGIKYFLRDLPDAYPFTVMAALVGCFFLHVSYKYYPSFYHEAWEFKPFVQALGHQVRFSAVSAPGFDGRLALGPFRCRFSYAFNYIPFAPGSEPGLPVYFLPGCGSIPPCRPDSSRSEFPMNLPAFRIGLTAEFEPSRIYRDSQWDSPFVEGRQLGHLVYSRVINQKAVDAAKEMWDFLTSGPVDPDLFHPNHPSASEVEPVLAQLEHMCSNLETPLALGFLVVFLHFLKVFRLRR